MLLCIVLLFKNTNKRKENNIRTFKSSRFFEVNWKPKYNITKKIINRPGVAGAEILREFSPPTACHMSHVTCHMSGVRCQVSRVTCHVSHVMCHMYFFLLLFFFSQSGEAYRLRVCYQRGLPRLVFTQMNLNLFKKDYSMALLKKMVRHQSSLDTLKMDGEMHCALLYYWVCSRDACLDACIQAAAPAARKATVVP